MNETADFCSFQKQNCQLLTMGEGGQRSDFEEIVVRWVSRVEQENELVETLQSRDAKANRAKSLEPVLFLLILDIFTLIIDISTLMLLFFRQNCTTPPVWMEFG